MTINCRSFLVVIIALLIAIQWLARVLNSCHGLSTARICRRSLAPPAQAARSSPIPLLRRCEAGHAYSCLADRSARDVYGPTCTDSRPAEVRLVRNRVIALALPGVLAFDLGCALQVFSPAPSFPGHASRYDFVTCGVEAGRVRTSDGSFLYVDHGLTALDDADTVVVPGYDSAVNASPPLAAIDALAGAGARGARMMAICVGAFALGHTGLLDGRRVTTHWSATTQLAAQFSAASVDPTALYTDDGDLLTSAGFAAGLDLALHVVRRDHGAAVAAELARWNVTAPHRDGGQAQFVTRPLADEPDQSLEGTRAWAIEHLDRVFTLVELARHAACSQRTLTRKFKAETGCSPKQWVQQMRLQHACGLLETTGLPIEQVASRSGFPTANALRTHFRAELKTTPTSYRLAFRGQNATRMWPVSVAE